MNVLTLELYNKWPTNLNGLYQRNDHQYITSLLDFNSLDDITSKVQSKTNKTSAWNKIRSPLAPNQNTKIKHPSHVYSSPCVCGIHTTIIASKCQMNNTQSRKQCANYFLFGLHCIFDRKARL